MKKLKYILFIIPLFFIFIGNSKAFDILTCGDTVITEQTILDAVLNKYSDFDLNEYPNLYCSKTTYPANLDCNFIQDNTLNLFTFSSLNAGYRFNYYANRYNVTTSSSNPCNIIDVSFHDNNSSSTIVFYYPLSANSKFLYTNFDSSIINDKVGNNYYNYNVLMSFNSEPEPETPTIENKIYLPDELQEGSCPIILNKDVIRVYDEQPTVNTLVSYTDYFINSHYIKQTGDDMPTDTITCLDLDNFTTAYVYRFDFDKIIVIFVSILFLIAYPVMKIIHAFFVGFKRR